MIGNFDMLPEHTKKAIGKAMEETKDNDGMTLNFAMNYGSRLEIVNAVKEIAHLSRMVQSDAEDIDESLIECAFDDRTFA